LVQEILTMFYSFSSKRYLWCSFSSRNL